MDFFEAQERAKQRTRRLVVLFAFAVGGTILAGYFAAIFVLGQAPDRNPRYRGYETESTAFAGERPLWQPQVFATVSVLTLAVVGLASFYKWTQFRTGGGAVAESVGGRRIESHTTDLQERRLLNVVEEMAIASGVGMPTVYVLDDEPGINAFAAGLTTSDAVVAVTRGTLEKLTRDELQGVIGHEFSHILNGDMRLNVKLSAILFGILVLGLLGRGILNSLRFSRPRGKNSGGGVALVVVSGLALVLVGYVGYFFGRLIQAAVSRQREFLADASSVQFTRNPEGLTGALRKIGGYALGSSIQATKGTAIGHFFFAQGFRSMFGGLWATHPPLPERIRAIDPQFDGTFIEPPQVVDVTRESFVSAGLAPARAVSGQDAGRSNRPSPDLKAPFAPAAGTVMATAGTLTTEQLANAGSLLASVPPRLLTAARSPHEAPVLLYGLLLELEPETRRQQTELIASRSGDAAARLLAALAPALQELKPAHKLPLLQLAQPALRNLPPAALEPFFSTLDELVHIDGHVSTFEFALQKIILRTLAVGRAPGATVVQIYSFNAVAGEIAIVLSALAHHAGQDPARNFSAGAAQLKLLEGKIPLLSPGACDLPQLDAALDKLATSSGPIKQRLLVAAAHVVSADGVLLVAEAELLRAVAATLDVPMPLPAA